MRMNRSILLKTTDAMFTEATECALRLGIHRTDFAREAIARHIISFKSWTQRPNPTTDAL